MTKRIIGIDAGSGTSGVILLVENQIQQGYNITNDKVMDFVTAQYWQSGKNLIVIIEDVRPYSMRITDGIIQTIKFLGELEFRLKEINQPFELIPRWSVKQWIFLQFKTLCIPEIEKKIVLAASRAEKKHHEKVAAAINHGNSLPMPFKARKSTPTFVYVDDRIVANAMRKHWGIQNPSRVGEKAAYGLKDHSWQSLGLVSFWMATNGITPGKG